MTKPFLQFSVVNHMFLVPKTLWMDPRGHFIRYPNFDRFYPQLTKTAKFPPCRNWRIFVQWNVKTSFKVHFSNHDFKLLTYAHFYHLKQLPQANKIFLSSCGSLKSRQGVGSGFWDILSDKSAPITILSQREVKAGSVGPAIAKPGELTLTLTSVSAPLSLLHLQSGTSRFWLYFRNNWFILKIAWSSLCCRCCNLC